MHHSFYSDVVQDESARSNLHGALLTEFRVYPPFPPNDVPSPRVLDLGSGTGRWCSNLMDDPDNGDCMVSLIAILPGYSPAIPILC
jgi:hypothetical protein